MAENITEEEKEFKVTHEDGSVSTIKGKVVTTDHGEVDEDGYPKISTHISMDPTQQTWPVDPSVDVKKEGVN